MVGKTESIDITEFLTQIEKDFSFIKSNPKILGVILYGSFIYGENHSKSDIDICIATRYNKLINAYNYVMKNLDDNLDQYDIRFFKELPLTVQGEIMENGKVVISNNIYELYEYFFPFRKRYEDWKIKVKYCI